MIPFDFEYYKPATIDEAVKAYKDLELQGKDPYYYGGGTEIITMGRVGNTYPRSVIDIKGIPECNVLEFQGEHLLLGAAVTLTQISEANVFPLLGNVGARIADHTVQGKITLGGNMASTIIYRETSLPLLLSDSKVLVAGKKGISEVPFAQIFSERLRLEKGELIVQVITERKFTSVPYVHMKKTTLEKIDYPLVTIVALKDNQDLRIGISGLCDFPFRSQQMEEELNRNNLPLDARIDNAINSLPAPIKGDLHGSAEYRAFVLRNSLTDALIQLEGVG